MKDNHTVERVALLHPKVRDIFTNFINDCEAGEGITLRVVQGYRTFQEQQAIYDQGRTKPGEIVTYSPPGTSFHNYGLAADIAPIIFDSEGKPKDLDWNYNFKRLQAYGIKYGITWGGAFPHPDLDHFENKCGTNWRDLLHKYQMKDFIEGTTYVNI